MNWTTTVDIQNTIRAMSLGQANAAVYLQDTEKTFPDQQDRTGRVSDLQHAIAHAQESVKATPLDHPKRAMYLNSLGQRLGDRYGRTGSMDDLEQAIAHAQEAVDAAPLDHPDRAMYLNTLGNSFADRYGRTGSIDDLEQAIAHVQEAVKATPLDHPDRAMYLNALGNSFRDRYGQTDSMDDLDQAIAHGQEAVKVTPLDHPDRVMYLNNLGNSFADRYGRTGSIDDLEQAIAHAKESVKAMPLGHPKRATHLNNLGNRFGDRYRRTGSMGDLEQAITYAQESVKAMPLDHPKRAMYLNNLGNRFGDRYGRTGSMDDLEQAIAHTQETLDAAPLDHPDRAMYLNNLGNNFVDRCGRTGDQKDDERSVRLFEDGVNCSAALPLHRVHSGRNAIRVLHRYSRWKEAGAIVETIFGLLPHICDRYLSRDDQQHVLKQVSGFAADACSLSLKLNDPRQALQRIEFGRALILGYLMDGRSDISKLTLSYPDLAREYEELRSRAFRTATKAEDKAARERRSREQRDVPQLIEDCERRIRDQPGFDYFLRPASVHDLMQSAEEGPIVVVNCTDISSDAIIVFTSGIEVVPLPSMSPRPPRSFQNALARHRIVEQRGCQRDVESDIPYQHDANLLSWLWLTCVSPILQKVAECRIGRGKNEIPRVWWIGTGAASSLPFHAAGSYTHDTPNDLDRCLLQCISSYTPSIKSLKHARMIASRASKLFAEERSLLVVIMPTTPGQGALVGAALEGEAIQGVVAQKWAVKSLAHPTASHVLEEIRTAKIVHFACHGSSDTADPMASHLLLQKEDGNKKSVDELTVSALLDASVQTHAWIAYLSACSTAEVKMQNMADESLHLTSAFQMAGFAHVIGSLRPADDQICVQVARLFYSFLVNDKDSMDLNRAVPEALNHAVRQISKEHPNRPDFWAPFIHLGA
jgi:tetratricopeptide (TPR) repeat protein